MRRILLVLAVAALMAAMVPVSAVPAFAKENCKSLFPVLDCSGGGRLPGGTGGAGGHLILDFNTLEGTQSGGGGRVGGRCTGSFSTGPDCVGKGFTGGP